MDEDKRLYLKVRLEKPNVPGFGDYRGSVFYEVDTKYGRVVRKIEDGNMRDGPYRIILSVMNPNEIGLIKKAFEKESELKKAKEEFGFALSDLPTNK